MQTDYTHVSILLDRSGSMANIKSDIIGDVNNFIDQQKKVPGKYTITLVQFDHDEQVFKYDVVYNMVDVTDVKPLTDESFQPRV
ncbi:MAG: hypothetical protein M3Z26_17930 [Bacteroidota bacterium]|nr:hypothetical protein [Bacteroidota bacterium]